MERPADWQCPNAQCLNHTKMVFGTKETCPKCGTPRDGFMPADQFAEAPKAEKGMQGGDMPRDWQCPNSVCINHSKMVFGKNASCPSCGTARNAKQPGDWLCPNTSCVNQKNTVFASKTRCPKCGSSRPGSVAVPAMAQVQNGYGGGKGGGYAGGWAAPIDPMSYGGGCGGCGGCGGGGMGNPGDWQCPNSSCLNHSKMVFGKHDSCPKCGSPKGPPVMWQGGGGGGGGGGGFGAGGFGLGGGFGAGNPGDWRCPNPECKNHRNNVFAKHSNCPSCGSEKPLGGGAAVPRGYGAVRAAPY